MKIRKKRKFILRVIVCILALLSVILLEHYEEKYREESKDKKGQVISSPLNATKHNSSEIEPHVEDFSLGVPSSFILFYFIITCFLLSIGISMIIFEAQLRTISKDIPILKWLIDEQEPTISVSSIVFNKFKSNLLAYTIKTVSVRIASITNREIFSFDFPIDTEFTCGSKKIDTHPDWKENIEEGQFIFITGESGSGKSYELIKRAEFLCNHLEGGLLKSDQLSNRKNPLYIELKSLDDEFDEGWIIDYINKSGSITNIDLNKEEIEAVINSNEIIYFFDGLDEVDAQYRENCVRKIIELSKITGVYVTCRKSTYNELKSKNLITPNNLPAEYNLKPLSEEWVTEIISSLKDYTEDEKSDMNIFIQNKRSLIYHLSRPIILNLFISVYHRLSAEKKRFLESANINLTLDILWENYEDLISEKKLPKTTDILGMRTYTVWLAKIMHEESFFVESIQPSWLSKIDKNDNIKPSKTLQRLYYLSTRILASVTVGIALGLIVATPLAFISNSILGGMIIAGIAGIYEIKMNSNYAPSLPANALLSILMIIILVLLCGGYQGLSVPGAGTSIFSITEARSGVLLGITLSVIFSYRIILEKANKKYILPIELFHFDWFHALKYGLSWGFISGIIVGSVAVFVKQIIPVNTFTTNWLIPIIERSFLSHINLNAAIFLYAFMFMFIVASLIIVILAGRYDDKEQIAEKKQKLNYGIKESMRLAIKHSLKVAVLILILYSVAMKEFDMRNWYYSIKIALGVSLLAFLWYGGMEVINHILLRINLYIRGIAPLNYDPWVQANQNMGFIIPIGYQMKFFHSTLADYYMRYPLKNNSRIRIKKDNFSDIKLYVAALIIAFFFLTLPFILRFHCKKYWKSRCEIEINKGLPEQDIEKKNDSIYLVKKTGEYNMSVKGCVNVGTFVGWVGPEGTRKGFMGMPLDSAYNIKNPNLDTFMHAALLIRWRRVGQNWSEYKYVATEKKMGLKEGDTLQFIVNDKECQNNTGHYKMTMSLSDTDKKHLPKNENHN